MTTTRTTGIVVDGHTLDVWRRTGTPGEVVKAVEALLADEERIREQQFLPAKERSEISKLHEHAASVLAQYPARVEQEAAKERDRELAAEDEKLAKARTIPAKLVTESDTEYAARLTRTQIEDVRRNSALLEAGMDVALASQLSDAGELALLVDDALAGGRPEVIGRVGRAVQARLRALAGAETKAGAVDQPAFVALMQVQDRLRTWRAQESTKSPTVRRQRIQERYLARVHEANREVGTVAEKIGLSNALAVATARLPSA